MYEYRVIALAWPGSNGRTVIETSSRDKANREGAALMDMDDICHVRIERKCVNGSWETIYTF